MCVYGNPFSSTMDCLEKYLSSNNLTESILDLNIIDINVWNFHRDVEIDLGSFYCGVDMEKTLYILFFKQIHEM